MTMQKPLSAKMNATILGQRLGAPVALHDPAAGPKCRKPQLRVAKDRHPSTDLTAVGGLVAVVLFCSGHKATRMP
jgi:hypothetical protein